MNSQNNKSFLGRVLNLFGGSKVSTSGLEQRRKKNTGPCHWHLSLPFLILTRGLYFIALRERGGERERDWLCRHTYADRDGTCSLGMCSDWESNPQHLGLWDNTATNLATMARTASNTLAAFLYDFFKE